MMTLPVYIRKKRQQWRTVRHTEGKECGHRPFYSSLSFFNTFTASVTTTKWFAFFRLIRINLFFVLGSSHQSNNNQTNLSRGCIKYPRGRGRTSSVLVSTPVTRTLTVGRAPTVTPPNTYLTAPTTQPRWPPDPSGTPSLTRPSTLDSRQAVNRIRSREGYDNNKFMGKTSQAGKVRGKELVKVRKGLDIPSHQPFQINLKRGIGNFIHAWMFLIRVYMQYQGSVKFKLSCVMHCEGSDSWNMNMSLPLS